MADDANLLRRYVDEGSQEAFAVLVERHLGLVYRAALRQVGGDAHRAQDVAQVVFADLARKARRLTDRDSLAGWLHTSTRFAARQILRAERRRSAREQEAFAVSEADRPEQGPGEWERIRPVIDDALHELGARDREVVLLRFFEGNAFAEIGRRFAVSEDAARMRVERALEKLRGRLARRGFTTTGGALGCALAEQATAAVPAGLVAQIVGSALTVGAGAGLLGGVMIFMGTTKAITAGLAALAIFGVGSAFYQASATHRAETALAKTAQQLAEAQALLAREASRSKVAEDDNTRLLAAVEKLRVASEAAGNSRPAAITKQLVETRYRNAQALARSGNWEAALPELLWCYDEGMVRVADFAGVRVSFLLSELGQMAEHYPPAMAALRERRDRAEHRMLQKSDDRNAPMEAAALNEAVGENDRNVVIFDQLPAGDPRRQALALRVYDDLIQTQRYADAAGAVPFERMTSLFEIFTRPVPGNLPNPERIREANRQGAKKTALGNIEVLAGAGDVTHAREMAQRLLAFEDSPETRRQIEERVSRAGYPGLLSK